MRNIFFYFAFQFLKEVGGGCHNNMKCILHMSTTTLVYLMMLNCLLFVSVCEINYIKGEFYQGHMQIAVNFVQKKKKPFRFFLLFFWGGEQGGTSILFP